MRRRRAGSATAAALVLIWLARPVAAQGGGPADGGDRPPSEPPPASESAPASESPPASAPPPPTPERGWSLELGGRVLVRDTMTRVDVGEAVWRHQRAIDQARVSATYERKRLEIGLEVDFAGDDAKLKDNFVRVKPTGFLRVRAGRFKVPMSYLGNESKWKIPSIERGLLSELELDDRELPFAGGRAEGLSVELRPRVTLDPRITAAAFQSPLAGGLDPTEDVTQDVYLHAEIEPVKDIHVAAGFAMIGYDETLGVTDSFRHVAIGSLEVFADTRHVRAWLEAFTGESFAYQADGSSSGSFVAGRALVSPRLRDPGAGVHRLEPYAGASLFDPTSDVEGDRVTEVVGGLNVALSRYWRIQLEGARRMAQGVAAPLADTTLFRVQVGAAFSEILD